MIDIGPIGIWQGIFDRHPAGKVREAVAKLDEMGWPCLWIPETVGRDPFVAAAMMLESTNQINIATGIASIWARDAMTTANAANTLNEAYSGRFLLGLGVSHHTLTEGVRKHDYSKPYSKMKGYLEQMDSALYLAPKPTEPSPRVLAALGPKMLKLGADKADGVHPYFVPVEHTALAREAVGPDKMVATELMIVMEEDPATAREIARKSMAIYLTLPNYANNLMRQGFTETEISEASDNVVDAIVAWGSIDTIAKRVKDHQDAGASHVCLQVLDGTMDIPESQWSELASALL